MADYRPDEGGHDPMPILSYLAYPAVGRYDELAGALAAIPECEVHESEPRGEVLVLVTDTADAAAEKGLKERLDAVESLQCLAMVFGHRESEQYEVSSSALSEGA